MGNLAIAALVVLFILCICITTVICELITSCRSGINEWFAGKGCWWRNVGNYNEGYDKGYADGLKAANDALSKEGTEHE